MFSRENNPWYLNKLSYNGNLYHYTDEMGYRGIIKPKDNINGISLRLTRINCLTAKDNKEREHIQETVKAVVQQLKNEGRITYDFYKKVSEYQPTYQGYATIITENNGISIPYGKVDYYIGCFSTNPNNEYIKQEFSSTRKIKFNRYFSVIDNPTKLHQFNTGFFSAPNYFDRFYPYVSLKSCFLDYYMKKVLYQNHEKENLIREDLLEISQLSNNFQRAIEQMYYLYDGFFKSDLFEKEEEVRLLVKVPQTDHIIQQLEKNCIRFADGDNEPKKYLYLPISFEFLEKDSFEEIKYDQKYLTFQ